MASFLEVNGERLTIGALSKRLGVSVKSIKWRLKHWEFTKATATVGATSSRGYRKPVQRAFWAKVDIGEPDACWLWRGCILPKGYGKSGTQLAHRISYALHNGPIPDGLFVLHKCDNPSCVNPRHLFVGTQQENMADCVSKGRGKHPIADKNKVKTHCLRGHALSAENLRLRIDGKRGCKQCERLRKLAKKCTD